jgi:hypothetical protein
LGNVERSAERKFADEVMRHPPLQGRRRLRAENFEAGVDLKCVGSDDFAIHPFSESHRELAFSHRGRAKHQDCIGRQDLRQRSQTFGKVQDLERGGERGKTEASIRKEAASAGRSP